MPMRPMPFPFPKNPGRPLWGALWRTPKKPRIPFASLGLSDRFFTSLRDTAGDAQALEKFGKVS